MLRQRTRLNNSIFLTSPDPLALASLMLQVTKKERKKKRKEKKRRLYLDIYIDEQTQKMWGVANSRNSRLLGNLQVKHPPASMATLTKGKWHRLPGSGVREVELHSCQERQIVVSL